MFFTFRRLTSLSIDIYTTVGQISFAAFEEYMMQPNITKRVGYKAFKTIRAYAKGFIISKRPDLLTPADQLLYQNNPLRKKTEVTLCGFEVYHNPHFACIHDYKNEEKKSYFSAVPFSATFNKRKALTDNIETEIDLAKHFFAQFKNDLEAMKKPKRILNGLFTSLFGKLVKPRLLKSILELADHLNKLKMQRNGPIYYLDHPNIQNKPGYQQFVTLSEIAMNTNALADNAKPSLAAPLKNISEHDFTNLFPDDSNFKAYLAATQSWWGALKSYIPFTTAYNLKIQIILDIEKANSFMSSVKKEFRNNSIATLVNRYPLLPNSSDMRVALATSGRTLRTSSNPSPRSAANAVVVIEGDIDQDKSLIQRLSEPPTPSTSRISGLAEWREIKGSKNKDQSKWSLTVKPDPSIDGKATEDAKSLQNQSAIQLDIGSNLTSGITLEM